MTDTEIVLACLLLLSGTLHAAQAMLLGDARRKLAGAHREIRFARAMSTLWQSALKELRRESHRRCPRTGRLLPKGK